MSTFSKYLWCILLCISLTNSGAYSQTVSHLASISDGIIAPLRITTDRWSNVYVSDAVSGTVSKYDKSGSLVSQISSIESPVSLAIDYNNRLFIGDGATGYIYLYDENAGVREYFTGSVFPSSMVFSPDNSLYISDSKLQEVLVLDVAGKLRQTIGNGTLEYPTGIAFDNNNKRVIVGEHGGSGTGFTPLVKVWVYDLAGNLVNSFGSHGSGDGQFYRVQGLSVGKCGDIYVVDPYQTRVSIFDADGSFKSSYGEFGITEGQLNVPMDIAFDSQNRMIVSSLNNGILELFEMSDNLPCSNIRTESKTICAGETADIEISFTGTAPWIFTYTVDEINPVQVNTSDNPYILTVNIPGHYEIVSLQDANYTGECFTGSVDIILSESNPQSNITGDATICDGETADIMIDFSGSPPWTFTYTIDGQNPQTIITASNPHIIKAKDPGHYEIIALTGGGCDGTVFNGSADIEVNEPPTSAFRDGNDVVLLWPGQTVALDVELTGLAPWSISYTIDDKNTTTINNITEDGYTITTNEPGTYEIISISDALCSIGRPLPTYPDVVLVPAEGLPTSSITTSEYSICPGDFAAIAVQFTGIPPWTFSYTDEAEIKTISRTIENPYIINACSPGVYEVTALNDSRFDAISFMGKATVSVSPVPVAEFSYSSDKQDVSFTNMSLNATSYQWDFGDGNTSDLQNPIHNYDAVGEYTVSLTSSNGQCRDSTIIKSLAITAVSNEVSMEDEEVKIYPNPTNGPLSVEINAPFNSEVSLDIYNQLGMKIYSENYKSAGKIKTLDLSAYTEGYYFIKISFGESSFIEQIILRDGKPE